MRGRDHISYDNYNVTITSMLAPGMSMCMDASFGTMSTHRCKGRAYGNVKRSDRWTGGQAYAKTHRHDCIIYTYV